MKPKYFPTPEETCECGYCGYRANLIEFWADGLEHNGSICPRCGDVADYPPLLDDKQIAEESKEKETRYIVAEYCAGPFYSGWWLYEREHNDGRPNSGYDCWGWLQDDDAWSKKADVHRLCVGMGFAPPTIKRHSQNFAAWFADTFPAGLLVEKHDRDYRLITIVRELPKPVRRAIRTIRGASISEAARKRRRQESTP
jgi:hypothetical protein